MPANSDEKPKSPKDEEEERDRRAANIFLLVAAIVLIGVGVWLADAMITARKADDCLSSGRRNCNPIEVPER
jgi:cytoskeletal protein RodZ